MQNVTDPHYEGITTVTEPFTETLESPLSLQSGFFMGAISLVLLAVRNYQRRR